MAGTTLPAFASGGVSCSGDGITIDLATGHLAILSVLDASISIGDAVYSTSAADAAIPITIGQAFGDDTEMRVDFTDDIVNEIVGSLRLFIATDGGDWFAAGVYSMPGQGAWAVSCDALG